MLAVPWGEFARADPLLAGHVGRRLGQAPCFLATNRADGWPRLHPVGPLQPRDQALVVTMYPTSPKRRDLLRDNRFSLHGPVEDTMGGGGEVLITGRAFEREPSEADIARGYVIFELFVGEVLAVSYAPEDARPVVSRWPRRPAAGGAT